MVTSIKQFFIIEHDIIDGLPLGGYVCAGVWFQGVVGRQGVVGCQGIAQ